MLIGLQPCCIGSFYSLFFSHSFATSPFSSVSRVSIFWRLLAFMSYMNFMPITPTAAPAPRLSTSSSVATSIFITLVCNVLVLGYRLLCRWRVRLLMLF